MAVCVSHALYIRAAVLMCAAYCQEHYAMHCYHDGKDQYFSPVVQCMKCAYETVCYVVLFSIRLNPVHVLRNSPVNSGILPIKLSVISAFLYQMEVGTHSGP